MTTRRKLEYHEYVALFEERYPSKRAAFLDACCACWEINKYAKHPMCSEKHKGQCYSLKNRWISMLYRQGFCIEAIRTMTPLKIDACRQCRGYGIVKSGMYCRGCGGTGTRCIGGTELWVFTFLVDGQRFCWHQPGPLSFDIDEDKVQHKKVNTKTKSALLTINKFNEAKALIKWCLS